MITIPTQYEKALYLKLGRLLFGFLLFARFVVSKSNISNCYQQLGFYVQYRVCGLYVYRRFCCH